MAKRTQPVESTSMPIEPVESGRAATVGIRRCIGSKRFGIDAHEAPVEDFPTQPSQKDGLGRMCKTHWNQYTAGLARDAKARKAAVQPVDEDVSTGEAVAPPPRARSRTKNEAPAYCLDRTGQPVRRP